MKTSQDILQEGRAIHGGAMKRSGSTVHNIILPCFLAQGGGRDIPKALDDRHILVYQSLQMWY